MSDNVTYITAQTLQAIAAIRTFVNAHMIAQKTFLDDLQETQDLRAPVFTPNPMPFPPEGVTDKVHTMGDASVDQPEPIEYTPAPLSQESGDIDLAEAERDKPNAGSYRNQMNSIMADVDAAEATLDDNKPSEDGDSEVADELARNLPTALPVDSLKIDVPEAKDFTGRYDATDDNYESGLLSALENKIISGVTGGTGVNQTVEDGIWNRDEARMNEARDTALSRIENQWSFFRTPASVTRERQAEVMLRHSMDMTTQGHDKTVKQAELEQKHMGVSLGAGVTLEGILLNHYNRVRDRAIASAKAVIDVGLAVMNGQLAKLAGLVDIGKTRVEAKIAVENLKLERYAKAVYAFAKKADSGLVRILGYSDLYEINNGVYKTALMKAETAAKLKIDIDELQMKHQQFNVESATKASMLNSRNYIEVSEIRAGILKALSRLQLETDDQSLDVGSKNLDRALRAAEMNINGFLEAAELRGGIAEAGALIHGDAIASANNSLTIVKNMASKGETIKSSTP